MDMQGRLGRLRAAGLRQDVVLLILFCAMVAAFSLVNPRFFSVRAMANILQDFCPVMLMAIGQTFVIASRGIDLSVGSVLGLAGVTMALVIRAANGAGLTRHWRSRWALPRRSPLARWPGWSMAC